MAESSQTNSYKGSITMHSLTSVKLPQNKANTWDPECGSEWDYVKPSEDCILRIKRDLTTIFNDPPPGMFVVPDNDDMTKIHALINGPFDTPYEGGFFYFVLRCPPDYPLKPPRVKLKTTSDGEVRFNPNLYRNGKVCLSLLGTWQGPAWSPANSLASVLVSIQSLMNEKPYHNEPGFEVERCAGDSKRYNDIIRHETIRVAVCEALEGRVKMPKELREVMEQSFSTYYDYYDSTSDENIHLDGEPMMDPFGEKRGSFCYKALKTRLAQLKERFWGDDADDSVTDSNSSESELEETHTSNNIQAGSFNNAEATHTSLDVTSDSKVPPQSTDSDNVDKQSLFTNG